MPDLSRLPLPDLSRLSTARRWQLLFFATLILSVITSRLSLPAAVLISAMLTGGFVALSGGVVAIPKPMFAIAQSVVGCMIARSISADTLRDIVDNWPLFVLMVVSVSFMATFLGWLLARTQVLPGSTAIWGTSPGAALVMTLMSEDYGADSRLVAFMQYSRVFLVSIAATVVAAIWGEPLAAATQSAAVAAFDWVEFAKTAGVILASAFGGRLVKLPSGPIILPMILAPLFTLTGLMRIELPWWLLWAAYFIAGWRIGLRYTRDIVAHALGALSKILITITSMIAACGIMGILFGYFAGIDPLTSYLATSPGGMDSVAIIASTTGGNMSFVMAVQVTRFIIVTATSPFIARKVGRSVTRHFVDKN